MSDEDRDIDIESDDEDGIGDIRRGEQPFSSQAEKRAHHNALERKRRDHIKDSFCSLRDSVPSLHGDRIRGKCNSPTSSAKMPGNASRAQILKKAADYIDFMRRKNSAHQQDIDDLKKQNSLLESQIRSLEKAKYTGNFAAMSGSTNIIKKEETSGHEGSGSDTESSQVSNPNRRKKLKTLIDTL